MLGTSGNLSVLIGEPVSQQTNDQISKRVSDLMSKLVYESTGQQTSEPIKKIKFLITVSGKDKSELTEDDFVLVNENRENGEWKMQNAELKPSAETLLHSAIYKHTNAKAVFHVHTTNSTLLSMKSIEGGIAFSNLEMLKGLGFKTHDVKVTVPVIENSQDMKYLAEIAPKYINEDVPGLLL